MAVGDGVDEAVEQLINTASALGSTTIDLSKKRLTQIPPEVLNLLQLEVNFTAILVCHDHTSISRFNRPYTCRSLVTKKNQMLATN